MSIASYRHNEALGVTGPMLPTDLPASLEQVYSYYELPAQTYRDYRRFARTTDFSDARRANAEQGEMIGQIVEDLGGFSCQSVEVELIDEESVFEEAVSWFLSEEWRVAVKIKDEIDTSHTVGIRPVRKGIVKLVSNAVPSHLSGKVTLGSVFKHLFVPKGRNPKPEKRSLNLTPSNRFLKWNLLALPNTKNKPKYAKNQNF
jgi:hypothetical protein